MKHLITLALIVLGTAVQAQYAHKFEAVTANSLTTMRSADSALIDIIIQEEQETILLVSHHSNDTLTYHITNKDVKTDNKGTSYQYSVLIDGKESEVELYVFYNNRKYYPQLFLEYKEQLVFYNVQEFK